MKEEYKMHRKETKKKRQERKNRIQSKVGIKNKENK
jgi:hypothetical protein